MKQTNCLLNSEFIKIREKRNISSVKEINARYIVIVQILITDNPDNTEFKNVERMYECDCINAALHVFENEYYYNLENMYKKGNSYIAICEKDIYDHIVPFINIYTGCNSTEDNSDYPAIIYDPVIFELDEFDKELSLSNNILYTVSFDFDKYNQ